MITNYSEIFKQHMLSRMNESDNGILQQAVIDYKDALNPKSENRMFFNRNNILDLIRRRKYDRAIKLIKSNKINAFSLFNDVNIFGNVYDSIPFIAAAFALAMEKSKNTESLYEKFNSILNELIIPSGINASNMFDAKFTSPNGVNDVLTFILTHDGQIKPKEYDEDSDIEISVLLNYILNGGYTLDNSDGIVRYVIGNDLISSLKKLIEHKKYELNIDDMKNYNISPVSNIGRFISFSAPHPFKFHSPEMEIDDKGKFCGGTIFEPLRSVGYDISKPEKEFKVHISIPFMIKDFIDAAFRNYKSNGESFSNESDINFGEGSEFLDAVNLLKYLTSEYNKYIHSSEMEKMEEDAKKEYMGNMVKTANANILRIQNSLNSILSHIGFPKVILEMHNPLEEDDKKILYKTTPFIKEIWSSVKLMK